MRRATRRVHRAVTTAAVAGTLTIAGWSFGQSDTPQTDEPNPDLLAGPDVQNDEAGDDDGAMYSDDAMIERLRTQELPPRVWIREVDRLDLSGEQKNVLEQTLREFRQAQADHRRAHGDEMQEIRRKLREARRGDQQAPAEVRKQLQAIREAAPKFSTYQQRIWEALDTGQREALTERLKIVREEMIREAQQRRERFGEGGRRGRGMRGGDDRRRGPDDMRPPGVGPGGRPFDSFDERGLRRMLFLMKHQTPEARRRTDERMRRLPGIEPPPPPAPGPPPPPPGEPSPDS